MNSFLYFARFQTKMGNWSQHPFSDQNGAKAIPFGYRGFSHDVTAAILGVEFFSYTNAFFCSRKCCMWLKSGNNPRDRTFPFAFTVMWKVFLIKAHLFDEIHGAIYYHSINQRGFLALLGKKKLWCFMTSTEFPPAESNVQSAQIDIDCPLIRHQCNVFSRSFKTFIFPTPTRTESGKKNDNLKVHSLIVYVTGWYIDYLFLAAFWSFLSLKMSILSEFKFQCDAKLEIWWRQNKKAYMNLQ